jgi:hypothetical protein
MQIKVKLFSVGGIPASDSSIIPRHVVEEYLASDKYKEDIAKKRMLGSLTHLVRNWAAQNKYNPSVASKTAGKDDQLMLVGVASPTHYIDRVWIEDSDQWVYCTATILSEEGMDDQAVQNIRRLKGMISNSILPGVSAVILGYWNNENSHDTLQRLVALKGFDVTMNPSWSDASVVEVLDHRDSNVGTKTFSETNCTLQVKEFSDLSVFGDTKLPKSSKISNHFTSLKAKQFSSGNVAVEVEGVTKSGQKEFSISTLKERVRYAKFSPRMRFRRLFLEYRQFVKQAGGSEKIDPETLKIMKSLFMSDVLDIFKQITPEVIAGKQVSTLIGASSLGKSIRVSAQKLQMPYRMAMQEMSRTGKVTPVRLQKIQAAYTEFAKSMLDEVFGSNPLPEELEEDNEKKEENDAKN